MPLEDPIAVGLEAKAQAAARNEQQNGHLPPEECKTVFEVLTARETCELPDPPAEARLLGELVVRGYRTVIGGDTGAGKTTLALAVLTAIVNGDDFLGLNGAGESRALVLDLEQGLRSVKRRLREAGLAGSDRVDYLRIPDGLRLDRDDEEVAALEAVLARGYDAVLLDPLYKAHGSDSNDERAIIEFMRRLDRWREQYGFALILPAHTRKPPPGETKRTLTIHDLFGSSALVRGAEVVVALQLVSVGFSRLYFFKVRDGDDDLPVGGDPWGLLFDREQGFRLKPERDEEAELREVRERVRVFVREHPDCSQRKVEEGVEGRAAVIRKVLEVEVEEGAIENLGDGSRKAFRVVDDPSERASQAELEWR